MHKTLRGSKSNKIVAFGLSVLLTLVSLTVVKSGANHSGLVNQGSEFIQLAGDGNQEPGGG